MDIIDGKPKAATPKSRLQLLQEAGAADKAWMAEVAAVFGAREAGLARFHGLATGEPGSRLRQLYDCYVKARDAYETR